MSASLRHLVTPGDFEVLTEDLATRQEWPTPQPTSYSNTITRRSYMNLHKSGDNIQGLADIAS